MATFDYKNYEHVFGNVAPFPDRKFFQDIEESRRKYDGTLFIDRVLRALRITKARLYPAKDEKALRTLHQRVCEATMSTHHRLSIFYYVLLDFDLAHGRTTKHTHEFSVASGIPQNYQIFMHGLWWLDRHNFEYALEHMSHPSLMADFSDEIMEAFVLHATKPDGDQSIALAYFHTVQPVLKSPRALSLLFDALARTSIPQALHYSRSYPDHTRQQLFDKLVASVLDSPPGEAAAERAVELVGLPLRAEEEAWFEEFLTEGEGAKLKKAKDTLVMRRIVTGRLGEAVGERGLSPRWGPYVEGLKQGLGGRE